MTEGPASDLNPINLNPGPGPDFDAIYAYAAQWIKMGDSLYEYLAGIVSATAGTSWTGDDTGARAAAIQALGPLGDLIMNPDNGFLGASGAPSACRVLWNIG